MYVLAELAFQTFVLSKTNRISFLQGATGEIELVKGNKIKVTTSDEFKEKCDSNVLYVDYQNINKVVQSGSRVYVDDGLISLVVKSIGKEFIFNLKSSHCYTQTLFLHQTHRT